MYSSIGCVVHCGKYTKNTALEGLINMKQAIIYIIETIIELKLTSKLILETSTGQGTELLYRYDEFLNFYNSFEDEYKNYFKICIDTCHVWAAGYKLEEIYQMTKTNGNLKDVIVIHINNSKNTIKSHLDRHDTILSESGFIPIEDIITFSRKMKKANSDITLILETPSDNFSKEIEILS
jgi:deoxyribonuclease-4